MCALGAIYLAQHKKQYELNLKQRLTSGITFFCQWRMELASYCLRTSSEINSVPSDITRCYCFLLLSLLWNKVWPSLLNSWVGRVIILLKLFLLDTPTNYECLIHSKHFNLPLLWRLQYKNLLRSLTCKLQSVRNMYTQTNW